MRTGVYECLNVLPQLIQDPIISMHTLLLYERDQVQGDHLWYRKTRLKTKKAAMVDKTLA